MSPLEERIRQAKLDSLKNAMGKKDRVNALSDSLINSLIQDRYQLQYGPCPVRVYSRKEETSDENHTGRSDN